MKPTFNTHGLVYWNEQQIDFRNYSISFITKELESWMRDINNAWRFVRVEGSCIMPKEFLSKNYSQEDYYGLDDKELCLSPETTPSSYFIAKQLLDSHQYKLPLCIYQAKKSFRKEDNKSSGSLKNIRLNEFYQLEYQMFYSANSKADYWDHILTHTLISIQNLLNLENNKIRLLPSDRLPSYSEKTMDIEVWNKECNRFMEVCSISQRTDFEEAKNIEVAIGLDRLIVLNDHSYS